MKINQTNNTRNNQTPEEPGVYCGSQSDFYRELPRKPRPLVAGMNWQNNLKNT